MGNSILQNDRKISKKRIEYIYKNGNKIHSSSLSILWDFKSDKKKSKISLMIAIPKKNIKKAVVRNQIRRKIKSIYRLHIKTINQMITEPVNMILTYNKDKLIEFNVLEREMLFLIEKIK